VWLSLRKAAIVYAAFVAVMGYTYTSVLYQIACGGNNDLFKKIYEFKLQNALNVGTVEYLFSVAQRRIRRNCWLFVNIY
jgi:hypothetical protein